MFSSANKTSSITSSVQVKSAGNTFFRKAGEDHFFGTKQTNSFFGKPIQTKLTVSKPDDPQEKEADAVADKVMRMQEPVLASAKQENDEILNRKEEEEVQAKQDKNSVGKIQCKLTPEFIATKSTSNVQKTNQKNCSIVQNIGTKDVVNYSNQDISLYQSDIFRQSGRGPPNKTISFEQTLAASKGGGSALPENTRKFMESRFKADFSGVRIHTDTTAQHLSSQVNAQAFAHGNDIYFNQGKYAPQTTQGGTLLAHELTHTIQQGASKKVSRVSHNNNQPFKTIHNKNSAGQAVVWNNAADKGFLIAKNSPVTPHQNITKKEDDNRGRSDTVKPDSNKAIQPKQVSLLPITPKASVATKPITQIAAPVILPHSSEKNELQQKDAEQEGKENSIVRNEFDISNKVISRSVIGELYKCSHCNTISKKQNNNNNDFKSTYGDNQPCIACAANMESSERGPPITESSVQPGNILQREGEAPPEKSWLDKFKGSFESTLEVLLPKSVYDFYIKIKNGGLLKYIKDILAGLFKGLFGKLGFSEDQIQLIFQIFIKLKSQLPVIIDGLAKGDCKPLFAALDLLSEIVGAIAGKVWDTLMAELEPVRLWLIEIWNTFGAPVVDEIKNFFGEEWNKLKMLGKFIWDSCKPIRDAGADAWDWVVKKLGFGTSDEPGLLSYVSDKLNEAWQNIKTELKPVIEPINDVVEGIKTLASLTDIQKLREDAKKWLDEVVKTATAMGSDEDAVASKQLTLRQVLLPALNKSIDRLKAALQLAANWITEKIGFVTGKVAAFISGMQGNTYLAPMYPLIKWLPAAADKLKDWATDKVTVIFTKIQKGVDNLKKFVEPLIKLLEKLVSVAGDILKYLPDLILGVPFMFMPRCIKDPIIKWLTDVVLRQIPVIGDFIALGDKWEEIKAAALLVLKQVFVDGQLAKGLWTYFKTLLGILGIDPKLVTKVIAKAAKNFSDIISKPGQFLKNIWNVIKGGFSLFWENIWTHLLKGGLDWLFGEVKGDEPIEKPAFTVTGILGFVLKLFKITKDNVYERMRKHPKIGPERVKKIQEAEKVLTGVLEWISVWIAEGSEGLLKKIKTQLGDLKNMVIQGIVSWVVTKITAQIMKKLSTSTDPLGIGATINIIIQVYDTIRAAVSYFNHILNIVNDAMDNMADIIAGNTKSASKKFEELLGKAVPVVIGFAVEAVLGKVGVKIKEIIDKVRKKIDDTIDALIDGAVSFIDGIIDTGKKVAGKVLGWLGIKNVFKSTDGEEHTLAFRGQESSAELTVSSTTMPVREALKKVPGNLPEPQKAAYNTALGLTNKIEKLIRTLQKHDGEYKPKDIDEINEMLIALSISMQSLMPLLAQSKSGVTGSGKIIPDEVYNVDNRKAKIIGSENNEYGEMIKYKLLKTRTQRTGNNEGMLMQRFIEKLNQNIIWKVEEKAKRELYMGDTPGKNSSVGKQVKERMVRTKKYDLSTNAFYNSRDGVWYAESKAAMGHVIDAVIWWNSNGRFKGMQNDDVLRFMQDPDNYELEESGQNNSRGASLGIRYLPPME